MILSDYLADVRRVLRDSGTLHPQSDLIPFINEARRRRDWHSRLVRKVVGFSLTAQVSTYELAAIAAGAFIRGDATPSVNWRDIVSVYVIPGGAAGGPGVRYPLGRKPYSWVSYLVSTSYGNYPAAYAVLGHSTVVLGPVPPQAYPAEWDLVGNYPALVNPTDAEPMPEPYNDPVKYLAGALAKENAQRFDEATVLEGLYVRRMNELGFNIRPFAVAVPGFDLPTGRR